jgi:hypothetical protein
VSRRRRQGRSSAVQCRHRSRPWGSSRSTGRGGRREKARGRTSPACPGPTRTGWRRRRPAPSRPGSSRSDRRRQSSLRYLRLGRPAPRPQLLGRSHLPGAAVRPRSADERSTCRGDRRSRVRSHARSAVIGAPRQHALSFERVSLARRSCCSGPGSTMTGPGSSADHHPQSQPSRQRWGEVTRTWATLGRATAHTARHPTTPESPGEQAFRCRPVSSKVVVFPGNTPLPWRCSTN